MQESVGGSSKGPQPDYLSIARRPTQSQVEDKFSHELKSTSRLGSWMADEVPDPEPATRYVGSVRILSCIGAQTFGRFFTRM